MSCFDVRLAVLASPDRARSLFTVRAAISSARLVLSPRCPALSLMCSYCRSRFGLDPLGMSATFRHWRSHLTGALPRSSSSIPALPLPVGGGYGRACRLEDARRGGRMRVVARRVPLIAALVSYRDPALAIRCWLPGTLS
jgi:hypothetical protein